MQLSAENQMAESEKDRKIYQIAFLVAFSCVLQIAESLIPHPVPGLRLGLANLPALFALITLGFGPALEISVLRTVLSSFMMGTFLSPAFFLSFAGALVSALMMGLFYWLSGFHSRYRLSIIGISIIGALSSNIVQLHLAYLLLVRHRGIFVFLPYLCLGAVFTGWITGAVAGRVCRKLKDTRTQKETPGIMEPDHPIPALNCYRPGSSFVHRLPAIVKVVSVFVLALAVLIFDNFWFYLGLFASLSLVVFLARLSPAFLYASVKKYTFLALTAFFLPVFFNSGTHVLVKAAPFKITSEGLTTGSLFAGRIIFLILLSSLLVGTTPPREITRALEKLLRPLRFLGISGRRVAAVLSLAWSAVPILWETVRRNIRTMDWKKAQNLRNLVPLLSELMAALYVNADPKSSFWERVSRD